MTASVRQWWRSTTKCPSCGREAWLAVHSPKPTEGPWLVLKCSRCAVKYEILIYALTPWWRRWGLGSRWISEEREAALERELVSEGPFR